MSLPQTTPDQRSRFYEDAESLIFEGFLTHSIKIGSSRLCLRSLGPGDLFMLRARALGVSDSDWTVWATATAVWMINGHCVLGQDEVVPRLAETIRRLPAGLQEILLLILMGLFDRQNKAFEATESYLYETESRYKWRTLNGDLPSIHSGIPGVEKLGTNYLQKMWMAYNQVEDHRLEDETTWEGFKLVASSNAPKGVKKLDQKDSRLRQTEEARRQAVMDRFYYVSMGVVTSEGKTTDPRLRDYPGARVEGPKSPDELAEDMRKWVVGEEDQHDRVVSEYKQRVRDRFEAQKLSRAMRLEAARQRASEQGEDLSMAAPMVAYTAEQLQEMLRNKGRGKSAGVRSVSLGEGGSAEYLYEKYIEKAPDAGRLQVEGGKPVDTLTDQVSQRKLLFSKEGPDGR